MASGEGSKGYLTTFSKAEDWLDSNNMPMYADPRDESLGRYLDVYEMRKSRCANAASLLNGLLGIPGITPVFTVLQDDFCPLFVPVLLNGVEERDSLRRYLIENDVYCPIHWPISHLHVLDDETQLFYKKSLSLVCDQRYDIEDMQKIVELIQSWQKTN